MVLLNGGLIAVAPVATEVARPRDTRKAAAVKPTTEGDTKNRFTKKEQKQDDDVGQQVDVTA